MWAFLSSRRGLLASHMLATCWIRMGKVDEAEPLMLSTIEGESELRGEDHPRVFLDRNNFGMMLFQAGRIEAALKVMRAGPTKRRTCGIR